jgi:serine/threonine-protein kinase
MAEAKAQNRYRVIERLESGGMAEVFRGEAESLAGFKKQVAIKRVLPHLAQNEKFIRMFLDEARLCARLNNANIVQVFDIGHVENTYFIVMEFVDGVNLKAIIEHMKKRNQPVPIGAAVFISMQVCSGLQYAHDLTDADGQPLGIVHRDMSPPNVLISKRGEIKIVDFGLAKAAMQVEKTDPGVVKGKFGYLAPETAMGQEAGPQADIFAVGIMLWEMLAGRRLFLGDSDYQTVKLVQQANIPSLRKINPDVPEHLEAIINKALARDRAHRYQTAEELAEDLAQFMSSHQIAVTNFDIAKIVREVIEEKRAQQKKEGKRDTSIIDKLIQEELLRFTSLDDDGGKPLDAGAQPLDLGGIDDGSKPLNVGQFEDLGNLASDVLGDFDPTASRGTSGWRQPALDDVAGRANLAEQLEGEDLSPPQSPPNVIAEAERAAQQPRASMRPVAADLPRVGSAAIAASIPDSRTSLPAPAPKKSSGGLIAAAAVVVLAGVGAALWLAGVIPH